MVQALLHVCVDSPVEPSVHIPTSYQVSLEVHRLIIALVVPPVFWLALELGLVILVSLVLQ